MIDGNFSPLATFEVVGVRLDHFRGTMALV